MDDNKNIPENQTEDIEGQPENCFELINKYGTYEIQPTNDSDNEFPEIAQGLPKGKNSTERNGFSSDPHKNRKGAHVSEEKGKKTNSANH